MLMGRGMALQQDLPSTMATKSLEKAVDFGQIDQLLVYLTRAKNICSFSNDYPKTFRIVHVLGERREASGHCWAVNDGLGNYYLFAYCIHKLHVDPIFVSFKPS